MNKTVDVSIIMPVYNLAPYLSQSLSSVLSQTFEGKIEVIIIDDGSIDNSLKIAYEIAASDSRIRVLHQENGGVSVARNTGLSVAVGKYVLFIDGDDIIVPDTLKILLAPMHTSRNVILSSGRHVKISSYEQQIAGEMTQSETCSADEIIKRILTEKYDISACAKLFSREKIGNLIFTPGKRINEDKYFLFRYLMQNEGTVVNTNVTVYGYYVRCGSVSNSSFSDKSLDMIYFSDIIEKDALTRTDDIRNAARYNNVVTHLAILKKIVRSGVYRENNELFIKIKKKTLSLASDMVYSLPVVHRLELRALKLAIPVYTLCVKLFDILRAKNNRRSKKW